MYTHLYVWCFHITYVHDSLYRWNCVFFDTSSKLTSWKWSTRRVCSASWYRFTPWPVNQFLPRTCLKFTKKKELVDNFSRLLSLIKTKGSKWLTPPKKWMILLMEEILHHLGCIKPSKSWEKLSINWLAGFLPSTVGLTSTCGPSCSSRVPGSTSDDISHLPIPPFRWAFAFLWRLHATTTSCHLMCLHATSTTVHRLAVPGTTVVDEEMTHLDLRLQNTLEIPFIFFGATCVSSQWGDVFFFGGCCR